MTKTQFKEAFKRGLGNSYIALRENNSREKYRDIVLWCCLRNTCYDMQCEGGRGFFLYNAICLYEDKGFFEEAIIQKLKKKNLDTCLFDQLSELLYLFALDGSIKAREALCEKYNTLLGLISPRNRKVKDNFECLCTWLTFLDGFPAFKSIVNQLGEYALRKRDTLDMDWFYLNAKNKFGEKHVDTYLQKGSVKSVNVEAFLNSVSHTKVQNNLFFDSPRLEDLIEASRERRSRGLALRFAKIATEDELIKLAKHCIEETNLEVKLELLWTFSKVRFPLDEQYIFDLAENDNRSIRDVAFEMMKFLPSNLIHDYAIQLIKQGK